MNLGYLWLGLELRGELALPLVRFASGDPKLDDEVDLFLCENFDLDLVLCGDFDLDLFLPEDFDLDIFLPKDFDLDLVLCGEQDLPVSEVFLCTEEVDLLPQELVKGGAGFDGAGLL